MSLEAIEKVSQAETKNRERKAAAEAEAKQIIADAEREGLALLQQARTDAEKEGKALLHEAEERPQPGRRRSPATPRRTHRLCGRLPGSTWSRRRSLLWEGL